MVVIEDVQSMNEQASNALLKTLEEPANGILILITSKQDKLLSTIQSRCHRIKFKPISRTILQEKFNFYLKDNTLKNRIKPFENELINLSNGSPIQLERNIETFKNIPDLIFKKIINFSSTKIESLDLAQIIAIELN